MRRLESGCATLLSTLRRFEGEGAAGSISFAMGWKRTLFIVRRLESGCTALLSTLRRFKGEDVAGSISPAPGWRTPSVVRRLGPGRAALLSTLRRFEDEGVASPASETGRSLSTSSSRTRLSGLLGAIPPCALGTCGGL